MRFIINDTARYSDLIETAAYFRKNAKDDETRKTFARIFTAMTDDFRIECENIGKWRAERKSTFVLQANIFLSAIELMKFSREHGDSSTAVFCVAAEVGALKIANNVLAISLGVERLSSAEESAVETILLETLEAINAEANDAYQLAQM